MVRWSVSVCFLTAFLCYVSCQIPPRLQIPGAIPVGGARPAPFRPQNALSAGGPRLRRPNVLQSSSREVRPVVEEVEEPNYPVQAPVARPTVSAFDEEVSRLAQQSLEEEEERPVPFRPERPVPIARDQIREKPIQSRPPPPAPTRAITRQESRNDPPPVTRQVPVRQAQERPRPAAKIPPRQQYDDEEDLRDRRRRPVVQILRKYRTDNDDGSITWGFENDDGTWKEETLGTDCIIRGKYGYVDPDDVKREFTYEAGNKCDEPELDEEEELIPQKQNIPSRNKPLPYARPQAQAQAQPQYVN
ncbi:uncharacterized protein LOC126741181 [Anthonomus grandis grandis]|uniref:uncharacterized protein LOC126741181 n=1 Tax=Anthonomus grandis grandis TaxID=2921223 RepID=UPI00216513C3|nr:uncharacterized protein LOC126741181 [Anthonomus grandis grandis]